MKPTLPLAALAATLLLAGGLAWSQPQPTPVYRGYLPGASAPDAAAILPPPPVRGDARDRADRAVFRATRALQGTPRWAMAQRDVASNLPAMMQTFSCAADLPLSVERAPRLAAMLRRVAADHSATTNRAKDIFKRKRPFFADRGEICTAHTPDLDGSYDYPSGHAGWSWEIGLILAEAAPLRATPILARARAYGESRVVCGVHNASAVEAGRTAGAAVVAALHGSPAFRADMAEVRDELATLRASGERPSDCEAEAALVAARLD